MGLTKGRVVIVTGAGRGLGRAYALELARQGAAVVVNDLGVSNHGEATKERPADAVAAEIAAMGGQALANYDDITDWDAMGALVADVVARFGRLDGVVNNAGFVRDRMFVSATPQEWDAVMQVHLRGHFCLSRRAVDHWRARAKAGDEVNARIINTTSAAGLQGSVGQSAYSAAKAGIAGLTLVQAAELGRYGITANAIAPQARTRMTEGAFGEQMHAKEGDFDIYAPENNAGLIAFLCAQESRDVTGQVFEVLGGRVWLSLGWNDGPEARKPGRWSAEEIGPEIRRMIAERPDAKPVYGS